MKKQLATLLLLALLLVAGLAACDDEPSEMTRPQGSGEVGPPEPAGENVEGSDVVVEPGEAEAIPNVAIQGNTTTGGESVAPGQAEAGVGDADLESTAPAVITSDIGQRLQETGAVVAVGGNVPVPLFQDATAQSYTVNDTGVQVYEFDDEAAAETAIGTVSTDGTMIDDNEVSGPGTPHFYRSGNAIIVYYGDDQSVAQILETAFGAPFAGG